ncbi:MAG: DUF1501 domain-containing protein [Verrucomicrobia bacterium]|nr:DUF1501 domain-containing protein [Verrucomicrobiota bacterium]MDA1069601.1 DUF1501 domain-containing protein [Verrucomicrobiota bacterium]
MDPLLESRLLMNRRQFFGKTATGLGTMALGSLLGKDLLAASPKNQFPNFPAKAKRVIYLFQSGAPSQMDLFDWKPQMRKQYDMDLPDSIRRGQRLTGMTVGQKRFPVAPTIFDFKQHGESRAWVSELLPNIARISDKLCFIKSMHTEAINHDPAITFFQTGSQIAGRPSIGSWLSYGLGSLNKDLPDFVAMVSTGTGRPGGQPLYDRLWGSGFLPTTHQGVKFRGVGDPVLYLNNPDGIDHLTRRRMLDDLNAINQYRYEQAGDPEIATRISQYELAYRMQTSVPDLTDVSDEPDSTFEAYGPESRTRGTYASNCIMARRLIERDVRFVQLFHMGWDQHKTLPKQIKGQCYDSDQATAALIEDLERRGLLEDTLVVWGGEFGRTIYSQGTLTESNYGRDHHPRCFTIFLTGAGIKQGITYGATDEYCYNITENPVHVHDLHATLLHILGIDHKRLTYKFQGRHYRLTDVHGKLVKGILA